MFNLSKETEISKIIPTEKLLSNFEFHHNRHDAIKNKFSLIEITNEVIDKKNNNEKVYFIKLVSTELDKKYLSYEYFNFIHYNRYLIIDLYNKIQQQKFMYFCNSANECKLIFYKYHEKYYFKLTDKKFSIYLNNHCDNQEPLYYNIMCAIEDNDYENKFDVGLDEEGNYFDPEDPIKKLIEGKNNPIYWENKKRDYLLHLYKRKEVNIIVIDNQNETYENYDDYEMPM